MEDLPSTDHRPPVSPRPSSPLSGEDYTDYQDAILGSRVRPRRRKAVRRSKSALDARPKLRLNDVDPREPPVPRVERAITRPPWTSRPRGRGRARQRSLPENTYLNQSERVIGVHQVSPEPEAFVSLGAPFHSAVAISSSRQQHSSSVSPEGSTRLSPTLGGAATAPTSDSSDRDQKSSNFSDVPRVQFKLKKQRTSSKKTDQENKKARTDDNAKKTKAMLNEPLSSDTEDTSLSVGKIVTMESEPRTRASVASHCSTTPTVTPSTSRSASPSAVRTPEQDVDNTVSTTLSDESSASSPQSRQPEHLDLSRDSSLGCFQKPVASPSVSISETLNGKSERLESNGNSDGRNGKGKTKRESTSFFKLPSLFKKSEDPREDRSLPASQQSSVVGLDWLFSTDSDSPSSGTVISQKETSAAAAHVSTTEACDSYRLFDRALHAITKGEVLYGCTYVEKVGLGAEGGGQGAGPEVKVQLFRHLHSAREMEKWIV